MDAEKFLRAQEYSYQTALSEIRNGQKQSHWIWYIFPQLAGLGRSGMSREYGLNDLRDTKEYLANPVLREHLLEITGVLLTLDDDIRNIMGSHIDAVKLRSSMTLFREAEPELIIFQQVLDKFYQGIPDKITLSILNHTQKNLP